MLNSKGESICELCFTPSETAICQNCSKAKRPVYYGTVPSGTLFANRYISGLLLTRNGISTDYLCFDTKNDMRVIITEYFPLRWAHRDSGTVAVKYHSEDINRYYADAMNTFRVETEALISTGKNRYISEILMSFREHNTAYRVMRYYGTRTLEKYMYQVKDRLPTELAVTAACQIAFGLQSLHAVGLTHGDISPENVIICNDGTIKLKGVAGNCRSFIARTGSFSEIIRPGYSAAELYKKGAIVTPESDYYSLGALLYYMLTGEELPDSISRLENGGVISPIENVSASVLLILGRLLSASVKDRESGFYELLNISKEYNVTPTQAPSAKVSAVIPPAATELKPRTENIDNLVNNEDLGFSDTLSFTEKINQMDSGDSKRTKRKTSKKSIIIALIAVLLIAAALCGIVAAYIKFGPGKEKPVNDPLEITLATQQTTEESTTAERTTARQTTEATTSDESNVTDNTTSQLTTAVVTTREATTAERTTLTPTTSHETTLRVEPTTASYVRTNAYQEGEYSVSSAVRIRTAPQIGDNIIILLNSGAQVTVFEVFDTGADNGDDRYWGYVRYQGSRYYYDGYVPMSALSIIG